MSPHNKMGPWKTCSQMESWNVNYSFASFQLVCVSFVPCRVEFIFFDLLLFISRRQKSFFINFWRRFAGFNQLENQQTVLAGSRLFLLLFFWLDCRSGFASSYFSDLLHLEYDSEFRLHSSGKLSHGSGSYFKATDFPFIVVPSFNSLLYTELHILGMYASIFIWNNVSTIIHQ